MSASARSQAKVAARRERVLQLREAGATFAQIAAELGHKSASAACQDATRALRSRREDLAAQVDLHMTLELSRLDTWSRTVETLMRRPGQSPAIVLRCVDRLTRLSERRAALIGLDGNGIRGGRAEPGPAAAGSRRDELAARRMARRAGATG